MESSRGSEIPSSIETPGPKMDYEVSPRSSTWFAEVRNEPTAVKQLEFWDNRAKVMHKADLTYGGDDQHETLVVPIQTL